MRSLTVAGLAFGLWGFWSEWFRGININMSGRYWYVFDSSVVYAIGFAAVLIVVLMLVSWRWNIGFELPVVVIATIFVVLAQWIVFVMGCMEIGRNVDSFWTSVRVRPSVFAMLIGQAMMLFGSFAAWSTQALRDFHELDR